MTKKRILLQRINYYHSHCYASAAVAAISTATAAVYYHMTTTVTTTATTTTTPTTTTTYYHYGLSQGWNDEKDRAPGKQAESLNIPEHRQPLIRNRSAKSTGKPRPTQTTSNMKTQKYANTNLPSRTRQCQIKTGDKARIPHHLECHLSHHRNMFDQLSSYRLNYHGQSMCILGMSISMCHLAVATHHIRRRSLQFCDFTSKLCILRLFCVFPCSNFCSGFGRRRPTRRRCQSLLSTSCGCILELPHLSRQPTNLAQLARGLQI